MMLENKITIKKGIVKQNRVSFWLFYKFQQSQQYQVVSQRKLMSSRLDYKDPQSIDMNSKEIKRKNNKSNSLDYKGMTLKQYFRLSEQQPNYLDSQIKQTQQQNICSSNEASTPYFNDYNGRQKIKTQVFEQKSFIKQKTHYKKGPNLLLLQFQNKTKQLRKQRSPLQNFLKKQHKSINKNIHALAPNKSHLNRSTVTSFYQLEAKKKKMLDKLKYQKQRINELKLSDVCFITKYGQKFHIDSTQGY